MDPLTQNILLGLFINGLSSLLFNIGIKFQNSIFEDKDFAESILDETDFELIIEETTGLEKIGDFELESICEFLKSPEIESIVRQIYASIYPNFSEGISYDVEWGSTEDIQKEFNLLFSKHFGVKGENNSKVKQQIFKLLLIGCEKTLSKAIKDGELSAHEAKSNYRFRILLDQLMNVKKNIKFLSGQNQLNLKETHEFIEKYRLVIGKRNELIKSTSYVGKSGISINDIYVYPNFIANESNLDSVLKNLLKIGSILNSMEIEAIGKQQTIDTQQSICKRQIIASYLSSSLLSTSLNKLEESTEISINIGTISLNEFLSKNYRAVILGDPGAGKTTFVKKICYDLCTKNTEKMYGHRQLTPVVVVLREYQERNINQNISIIEFIKQESNSNYQIPVPTGAFEYLLLNGYILLIFDGLDELLDTHYREKIVEEIDSFCTLYPSVPVLVTSRKVGYNEAPLRDDMFPRFELASFNEGQVREYVTKWFALDPELSKKEKENKAVSFLIESEIVSDLRSNPLMLSLMCSIYREENYIPENRPDVYQKCSEMLFEKWDKHRGISPNILVPSSKIKPLITHLAYSIFTNESLQKGVTERKLINITVDYLFGSVYEDRDDSEEASKDFIDFCKGRAWVFTDTGTTKNGENIYQFTHRTFLEYFTALWLNRNCKTDDELFDFLLPKICKNEWNIVAQLAFQIKDISSEGSGNKLITELIDKSKTVALDDKLNILSFSVQSLGFMVLSPKVIREVTTSCFEVFLESGVNRISEYIQNDQKFTRNEKQQKLFDLLSDLRNVSVDNRRTVAITLEELILEKVATGENDDAMLAAEFSFILSEENTFGARVGRVLNLNADFWARMSDNLFCKCYEADKKIFEKNKNLCIQLYYHGKISFDTLLKLHGLAALLDGSYFILPVTYKGLGYDILSKTLSPTKKLSLISDDEISEAESILSDQLRKIGSLFLSGEMPFFKVKDYFYDFCHFKSIDMVMSIRNMSDSDIIWESGKYLQFHNDCDSLFGAFCILALLFESYGDSSKNEGFIDLILNPDAICFTKKLRVTYLVRAGIAEFEPAISEINEIGFSNEQMSFIIKWMKKEISIAEWDSVESSQLTSHIKI